MSKLKILLQPKYYFSLFIIIGFLRAASLTAQNSYYEKGNQASDNLEKVRLYSLALQHEKKDNRTYYLRGYAYLSLSQYQKALADFENAEKAPGSLAATHIYDAKAWAFLYLGNLQQAKINATKALELDPENKNTWNATGWIAIEEEDYEAAIRSFTKFIVLSSGSLLAYKNRSYAYLLAKEYRQCLEDCNKILEKAPGDNRITQRKALALMHLNESDQAIALLRNNTNFKEEDPRSLSGLGNLYYQNGEYEAAILFHTKGIELYQKKIKEDPKFIKMYQEDVYNIYMDRGQCYQALEDHHKCLRDYTKATTINPNNYLAWYEIGELQTYKGNYFEAITAYEKAFALQPNLQTGWVNLGFCYSELNQEKKAIETYTRGIKANPNEGLLYNNRGYSYLLQKEYDKALADLQKAIEVEPYIVMSHVSLGEYYHAVKNYPLAISKFDQCIQMDGGTDAAYRTAYHTRGLCYMAQEKYNKAIHDFKEALKIDKDYIPSMESLGIAYLKTNKKCEAYKNLKMALRYDANNRIKQAKEAAKYLAKITQNPCN